MIINYLVSGNTRPVLLPLPLLQWKTKKKSQEDETRKKKRKSCERNSISTFSLSPKTGRSLRLWNWRRFFGFPCQTFRFIDSWQWRCWREIFEFLSPHVDALWHIEKKGNSHCKSAIKTKLLLPEKTTTQLWLNYGNFSRLRVLFHWRFWEEFREKSDQIVSALIGECCSSYGSFNSIIRHRARK